MSIDPAKRAASPCTGVCALDARGERCLGCRRTIAEIAAWPSLATVERVAILARLARDEQRSGEDTAPALVEIAGQKG